ncbi:MAG: membrane protein insertion efficiency factor YidD [Candidatus Krumholzibacteria bacterium]
MATLIPVFLIRCYQAMLRPLLIGSCRFYPSCSEYTIQALQTHGLLRGSHLAAKRLCRCHPFSSGGIDPVPESTLAPRSTFQSVKRNVRGAPRMPERTARSD